MTDERRDTNAQSMNKMEAESKQIIREIVVELFKEVA